MYQSILFELYCRHHQNNTVESPVASSFWRDFSRKHYVKFNDGDWSVSGFGLGYFLSDSLRNAIRHLPATFLSKRLMVKYRCSSRLINCGYLVARSSQRLLNFDCAKQLLAVNEIINILTLSMKDEFPFCQRGIRIACVIGDGYGFCTSLMKYIDPNLKVVSVNIGRSLFFDALFSQKCMPNKNPALMTGADEKLELIDTHSLIFLEAENYQYLRGLPIDLFVNITSMQEMNPEIVNNYFEYMRHSSSASVYFYCCNRREKILPDNTVVKFEDYPWADSIVLFDELCPWHQKLPTSDYPFWKPFEGPIQHRFVRLK